MSSRDLECVEDKDFEIWKLIFTESGGGESVTVRGTMRDLD